MADPRDDNVEYDPATMADLLTAFAFGDTVQFRTWYTTEERATWTTGIVVEDVSEPGPFGEVLVRAHHHRAFATDVKKLPRWTIRKVT